MNRWCHSQAELEPVLHRLRQGAARLFRKTFRRHLTAGALLSVAVLGAGLAPAVAEEPSSRGTVPQAYNEGDWLEPEDLSPYRLVFCFSRSSKKPDGERVKWEAGQAEAFWDWVSRGNTLVFCGNAAYILGGADRVFSKGVAALLGGRRYVDLDGTARVVDESVGFDPDWEKDTAWFSWKFGLGQLTSAEVWIGGDDYALVSRNAVGDGQVFFIAPTPDNMPAENRERLAAVFLAVIKASGAWSPGAAGHPPIAFFGDRTRSSVASQRLLTKILAGEQAP